jgi:hypothetical protein
LRFVSCDFEQAMHNAFRYHFAGIKIRGCYFHFNQAIWQYIANCGLRNSYLTDTRYLLWIKKIVALSFIPLDKVTKAFAISDRMVQDFIDYFKSTWLVNTSIWNHSEMSGPRTNNHVEGFHNKLNKLVGHNPKLVTVIGVFRHRIEHWGRLFTKCIPTNSTN